MIISVFLPCRSKFFNGFFDCLLSPCCYINRSISSSVFSSSLCLFCKVSSPRVRLHLMQYFTSTSKLVSWEKLLKKRGVGPLEKNKGLVRQENRMEPLFFLKNAYCRNALRRKEEKSDNCKRSRDTRSRDLIPFQIFIIVQKFYGCAKVSKKCTELLQKSLIYKINRINYGFTQIVFRLFPVLLIDIRNIIDYAFNISHST